MFGFVYCRMIARIDIGTRTQPLAHICTHTDINCLLFRGSRVWLDYLRECITMQCLEYMGRISTEQWLMANVISYWPFDASLWSCIKTQAHQHSHTHTHTYTARNEKVRETIGKWIFEY